MISPEFTPCESAQILEAMVKGVAWSFPMEFTLRYDGIVPHRRSKTNAHTVRCAFEEQLADYWKRDHRLRYLNHSLIKAKVNSKRFPRFDVRRQERNEKVGPERVDVYRYHEVRGVRFVPLVTRWRYLRCEVAMRIHRYEGEFETGGIMDHNGDLDNKCKTLMDALRMPSAPAELPIGVTHPRDLFFCVLEDDRLITKITMETRNVLGPRPAKSEQTKVNVDLDIKIYPVHAMGNINYEMLFP